MSNLFCLLKFHGSGSIYATEQAVVVQSLVFLVLPKPAVCSGRTHLGDCG